MTGSRYSFWDDDFDPRESTSPQFNNMYSTLSDSQTVVPYLQHNAENDKESSLSWGESFDAAWTGAAHGLTTYGPEQLYRAVRTLARVAGNVVDTQGIQDWATEGVEENIREREVDPWYRPDPRWMESEWGRSLYGGFSSFTSSMMTFLPAAGLAAATAPVSAGVGMGAALFTGAAYLAGSGATAAIAGMSEYDSFMDEAYKAAKEADPTISYDMLANEKFWGAVFSAVSEAGTEFASDAIGGKLAGIKMLGGKLAGVLGKPAADSVAGIVGKTLNNMVHNMATELGGEAANAAFQDFIREQYQMSHQGRINAIKEIIGPTLVAGALGGVKNTMWAEGGKTEQADQTDPKISEALLRQSDIVKRRSFLSTDAATLMDNMSVNSTDHGKTAFETSLVLDALANRTAEATGESASTVLKAVDVHNPALGSFMQTLRNQDASFVDVVSQGYAFLESRIGPEFQAAIDSLFTAKDGTVDQQAKIDAFIDYAKGNASVTLPEDARLGFEAMRNVLTDSAMALDSHSSTRASKETVEALRGKGYAAPKATGISVNSAAVQEVLTRWDGVDLSSKENLTKFMGEALPHIDLNLASPGAPKDAEGILAEMLKVYKPILERVHAGSGLKPNKITQSKGEEILASKPGFDLFSKTFEAVEGLDNRQAALDLVTNTAEAHVKALGAMLANTDGIGTPLEFQAMALMQNVQALKDMNKGIGREVARALQIRKLDKSDPKFAEKSNALMNGTMKPEARRLLWTALANADDQKMLDKLTDVPLSVRTVDAFVEYVTANMLFGPSTHIVNIMGNTLQITNRVIERAFGEFLTPSAKNGLVRGETWGMIAGFWQGLREIRKTWQTHRDQYQKGVAGVGQALLNSEAMWGQEALDSKALDAGSMRRAISAERFGLSSEHGLISGGAATLVDLLGSFTHIPFALLGHSDQIFKTIYSAGERNALIIRAANGDPKRMQELFANPPRDIVEQAQMSAKDVTFQNDLGKFTQNIDNMRNQAPWMRLFLPFLKTPINVFKEGISMVPIVSRIIGPTRERLNSPDVATRQLAEAHVMLGTLIFSTAMLAASAGYLTGPGPEDAEERRRKEATGWLPNAVRVGDKYVQLDRLDPVALLLNGAALLVEAGDHIDDDELFKGMLTGVAQGMRAVMSRTYMASLSDLMEFFTNSERGVPQMLIRMGGSTVPGAALGRTFNRSDPYLREAGSFWDGFQQAVPGLSSALPARRDFLGQPIQSASYAGPTWLSPFKVGNRKGDKVYDEVARLQDLGYRAASMPNRTLTRDGRSVKMTPREYSDFLDYYGNKTIIDGKTAYQAAHQVVDSPLYTFLDDEGKADLLKDTLGRFSKQAKKDLFQGDAPAQRKLSRKNQGWDYLLGNTVNNIR